MKKRTRKVLQVLCVAAQAACVVGLMLFVYETNLLTNLVNAGGFIEAIDTMVQDRTLIQINVFILPTILFGMLSFLLNEES